MESPITQTFDKFLGAGTVRSFGFAVEAGAVLGADVPGAGTAGFIGSEAEAGEALGVDVPGAGASGSAVEAEAVLDPGDDNVDANFPYGKALEMLFTAISILSTFLIFSCLSCLEMKSSCSPL